MMRPENPATPDPTWGQSTDCFRKFGELRLVRSKPIARRQYVRTDMPYGRLALWMSSP